MSKLAMAAVCLGGLVACSTSPQRDLAGREATQVLPLVSGNQQVLGQAILVPHGNTTGVRIHVARLPGAISDSISRPVHLYTYIHRGTCERPDPRPEFSLNRRVLASGPGGLISRFNGSFQVANDAPASLEALRMSPHAIVVQTAPMDGNRRIGCANIG